MIRRKYAYSCQLCLSTIITIVRYSGPCNAARPQEIPCRYSGRVCRGKMKCIPDEAMNEQLTASHQWVAPTKGDLRRGALPGMLVLKAWNRPVGEKSFEAFHKFWKQVRENK